MTLSSSAGPACARHPCFSDRARKIEAGSPKPVRSSSRVTQFMETSLGVVMPHYRMYILDEHGATIGAVDFEASDDEAAQKASKAVLGSDHRGELWRRIRSGEANGESREPR